MIFTEILANQTRIIQKIHIKSVSKFWKF